MSTNHTGMLECRPKTLSNETGFVLVAALSCLAVLSIIGIAAMNTSNTEKQIAQNINLAERTFYGADGATEIGIEMIEWNINCPLGFKDAPNAGLNDPDNAFQIRGVEVYDHALAFDETEQDIPWDPTHALVGGATGDPVDMAFVPSDAARSMRIPSSFAIPLANRDNAPHINVAIFGITSNTAGGSIQQAAGYEGLGKGSGGQVVDFQIWTQNIEINNAEAVIRLGWQHLITTTGDCRPYGS